MEETPEPSYREEAVSDTPIRTFAESVVSYEEDYQPYQAAQSEPVQEPTAFQSVPIEVVDIPSLVPGLDTTGPFPILATPHVNQRRRKVVTEDIPEQDVSPVADADEIDDEPRDYEPIEPTQISEDEDVAVVSVTEPPAEEQFGDAGFESDADLAEEAAPAELDQVEPQDDAVIEAAPEAPEAIGYDVEEAGAVDEMAEVVVDEAPIAVDAVQDDVVAPHIEPQDVSAEDESDDDEEDGFTIIPPLPDIEPAPVPLVERVDDLDEPDDVIDEADVVEPEPVRLWVPSDQIDDALEISSDDNPTLSFEPLTDEMISKNAKAPSVPESVDLQAEEPEEFVEDESAFVDEPVYDEPDFGDATVDEQAAVGEEESHTNAGEFQEIISSLPVFEVPPIIDEPYEAEPAAPIVDEEDYVSAQAYEAPVTDLYEPEELDEPEAFDEEPEATYVEDPAFAPEMPEDDARTSWYDEPDYSIEDEAPIAEPETAYVDEEPVAEPDTVVEELAQEQGSDEAIIADDKDAVRLWLPDLDEVQEDDVPVPTDELDTLEENASSFEPIPEPEYEPEPAPLVEAVPEEVEVPERTIDEPVEAAPSEEFEPSFVPAGEPEQHTFELSDLDEPDDGLAAAEDSADVDEAPVTEADANATVFMPISEIAEGLVFSTEQDASDEDLLTKDVSGLTTMPVESVAEVEDYLPPADERIPKPRAVDDPDWGTTSFKPQAISVGRRAMLLDLPDPSVISVDPLSSDFGKEQVSVQTDQRFDTGGMRRIEMINRVPSPLDAPTDPDLLGHPEPNRRSLENLPSFDDEDGPDQEVADDWEADEVDTSAAEEQNETNLPRYNQRDVTDGAKKGGVFRMRFGRKRQAEAQEDESLSEWLGVDDDYDAKKDGRQIGSWDHFNDDEKRGKWKGGATVRAGLRDEDDLDRTDAQYYEFDGEDLPHAGDIDEPVEDDYAEAYAESDLQEDLREAILQLGDDDLIAHDIWFVGVGASGLNHAGMEEFLAEHRRDIRGAFMINLDSIGAGNLTLLTREGTGNKRRSDRRIARMFNGIANALHIDLGRTDYSWSTTDATPAMQRSVRVSTLMGMSKDGVPALSHTANDEPEHLDDRQIADVADMIAELIRRS